jgi:anti-sigma B factor antagonist
MSIRNEPLNDEIWLITIGGRLDQSQTDFLQSLLGELIDAGHIQLIVDLTDLSYINSGGLRCLVTGWREANKLGGELILCGLNSRISEVFTTVGFDEVFQIFTTREEAQQHISIT